jgi:hypothetical protein
MTETHLFLHIYSSEMQAYNRRGQAHNFVDLNGRRNEIYSFQILPEYIRISLQREEIPLSAEFDDTKN